MNVFKAFLTSPFNKDVLRASAPPRLRGECRIDEKILTITAR